MKKFVSLAICFLSVAAAAQPLRDINFTYLYAPDEAFSFSIKVVAGNGAYHILFALQAKDTASLADEYSVRWEGRNQLSEKDGSPPAFTSYTTERTASGLRGHATLAVAGAPKLIVAQVVRNSLKRAWMFYEVLEPNHPVNNFLVRKGQVVLEPFLHTTDRVKLGIDSGQWIVSFYDHDFPPAAPVFSEAQARVSKGMQIDSVYTVRGGTEITFPARGLYLVQRDTSEAAGLAFRAEDDYPQFTTLRNLVDPFIYISTKQEYDRLATSKDNKRAFDRVVLGITSDTDRARTLMRNYFRKVELANRYFTSYKEGWKTDRGMVYIIFGAPDEVYRFSDREVWNYKTRGFNQRFIFSRSASVYDPGNYVLIRDEKYKDRWYEVIDLWRNARF